jgi:hypothetical protein
VRGIPLRDPPTGCEWGLRKVSSAWTPSWGDYLATIDYLRKFTRPETRVANLICRHPFPAINGPTARLTPLPSASGVLWMRAVSTDLEPMYADSLKAAGSDAVVVWLPDLDRNELNLRYPRIAETIRDSYRPEARFGLIGVWRRKPVASRVSGIRL